jgi:hypothetical protein
MKDLQLPGMLGLGNAIVLGLPRSFDLFAEIESAKEVKLATAFGHMSGWKEAVAKVTQFFKSQYFKEYYAEDRATVGPKIKQALNYPTFEFDREGLERFYKIQSLGHLIEIYKNRVWDQRKKLQGGFTLSRRRFHPD